MIGRVLGGAARWLGAVILGRVVSGAAATVAGGSTPARVPAGADVRLTLLGHVVGGVLVALSVFWPDLPAEALRESLLWVGGLLIGGGGGAAAIASARVRAELVKAETIRTIQAEARAAARVEKVAANIAGGVKARTQETAEGRR